MVSFELILQVANMSCGRKDLGEHWKNKMNGEAIPEAIKILIEVLNEKKKIVLLLRTFCSS